MFNKSNVMLLLLATIVINSGCESNAVRREEASTSHAEWTEHDKQLISEGIVNYGMTKEQVRAAWGQPCRECEGTKKYDSGVESWEYHTQVVFFDKEGKVTRWVER